MRHRCRRVPITRGKKPYVGMFAVLDHIDGRLKELQGVILSRGVSESTRAAARKQRDFLLEQERIVRGGGGWKSRLRRLDPELVEEVFRGGSKGTTILRENTPEPDRPSYWDGCEGMSFGELARFVDGGLQALQSGDTGDGPHSEEDFQDLLGLLREKAGGRVLPNEDGDPNRATGPSGEFAFSEALRALREECERYQDEAARHRREGRPERLARFQEQRAARCRSRADAWEAEEKQEHDDRRRVRLRDRSSRRGEASMPAALPPDLSGTVRRVERDIGRAFGPNGPVFSIGTLPWELLPAGQFTREGVRAHYERLARAYPERGYEPERMDKAMSLKPSQGWKGTGGFRGYMVFEYAGTEKVLLECPIYGNAIYVLGKDWRPLSRQSKGAIMADEETERIPHVGDWFGKMKWALGVG